MRNANLHAAKCAKNDEFYTRLTDVANELCNYKAHFANKVVFCNCDDPDYSAFWKYFHLNFAELGLKRLVSTHYDRNNSTYKMEYTGGNDNDVTVGTKVPLEGNGDFRNQECIDILDGCDVVVTNPPFSLFREYIAQLVEHDKKFLVIGSKNAITYKEIFPLIKDNKLWLGYTSPNEFIIPGGEITKQVNGLCRWFTNLEHSKRNEKLILWKRYTPAEYPRYDNYDAINVDKVGDIPLDYDGVMGVPITFLDKYCPEQFEILGITSGRKEFDERAYPTKYYQNAIQHNTDGSVTNGSKANTRATIQVNTTNETYYTADNASGNLIILYARILIKGLSK